MCTLGGTQRSRTMWSYMLSGPATYRPTMYVHRLRGRRQLRNCRITAMGPSLVCLADVGTVYGIAGKRSTTRLCSRRLSSPGPRGCLVDENCNASARVPRLGLPYRFGYQYSTTRT